MNSWRTAACLVALTSLTPALRAQAMDELLAVYATAPQGYPIGKEYARPDRSVPFRWHWYHEGAIEKCEHATMRTHVDDYNPLEGQGATTSNAIKLDFVAEHVTKGKQALRLQAPGSTIEASRASITIRAVAGAPLEEGLTASCYWYHYRWLKLDVYNPLKQEVRIRVCDVPFVLHHGANVVAVKTADASSVRGQSFYAGFRELRFEVVGPAQNLSLYLDHVRVEQEVPALISRRGRLFQFPGSGGAGPVLWPGFTPVAADALYAPERAFGWETPAKTRANAGLQGGFRSFDHGLMWGGCTNIDAPFRVDLRNGRYGVMLFAQPGTEYGDSLVLRKGLTVKLNGKEHVVRSPRSDAEARQLTLGAEAWDFRPGACIWEALVRSLYLPPTRVAFADVTDGSLRVELPRNTRLSALVIFPEPDRKAALAELEPLNYLLAESWDVTHPWVNGSTAELQRYLGTHEEAARPQIIPERLRALKLGEADFRRGFIVFERGLTEAAYPDTIPTPEELAVKELRAFAARGEHECLTLGLLPLGERRGLRCKVSDFVGPRGVRIPAGAVDVRAARYHQKTRIQGHHNKDYNYGEYYLVRRPALDLYPGCARRLYLDIGVPADAAAGTYRGQVAIADSEGKDLARIPVVLEVLDITLQEPPVHFAGSLASPELKKYGFNTLWCGREQALQHGLMGYVGYPSQLARDEKAADPRKTATEPRRFYSGYDAGQRAVSKESVTKLLKERPGTSVLCFTVPTYVSWSTTRDRKWHFPYITLAPIAQGTRDSLENDRKAGKEFWFVDAAVAGHEQSGRFTFGFWLWKLGARGRFSFLTHYGHASHGEVYYSLVGGGSANNTQPLMPALADGVNPARSLILIREGIDDYRYIHTLQTLLDKAQTRQPDSAATRAARKFRDELDAALSPDLSTYYEAHFGSDGGHGAEYWHPLANNPWRSHKFNQVRRDAAGHIVALRRLLNE